MRTEFPDGVQVGPDVADRQSRVSIHEPGRAIIFLVNCFQLLMYSGQLCWPNVSEVSGMSRLLECLYQAQWCAIAGR